MMLVIIFVAVAASVVPPLLSYASTAFKMGMKYEQNTQNLYAAESGIQDAIYVIKYEPPEQYPFSYQLAEKVNSKNVTVSIDDVGPAFRITSTAAGDNGEITTIECYVMYPLTLFDLAAASLGGDITISGKTVIDSYPEPGQAHIYSNGNINLEGKVQVQGDATACDNVVISGGSSVTGNVMEHSIPFASAELDTAEYLEEADEGFPMIGDTEITESQTLGPTHIYGDLFISGTANVTLTGTVWIDGGLYMSGSSHIEGAGTIVTRGDMVITGGGEFEPQDLPVCISVEGNITTSGNQRVYAVLYAPEGLVTVTGTSGLFGAVAGNSVLIETSSTLSYGLELRERNSQGKLEIISYVIH